MTSDVHGVLVVDKAIGPTSHDVVNVARRALGTKEIGHTGTLDPMASGVLVLVIGEATKLVNSLSALEKRYCATLKLGAATSTLDAQGVVEETAPVPAFTPADVRAHAASFLGEFEQRAPVVSAIKVDGQSLYKRARKGHVVEAPLRKVRLDAIHIDAVREEEIDFSICCGSGFYVRSLGRDLARKLGTVGHLNALRRTQNGAFTLAHAVPFDQLRAARSDDDVRARVRASVRPLADVCRSLPHVTLDEEGTVHARCGRRIPRAHASEILELPTLVAFDPAGVPVALVAPEPEQLRVLRGFRPV
ncbi:MAG TPA: tRNA pseudouridine(55) synthase TruB [Polyangiales bacterium]